MEAVSDDQILDLIQGQVQLERGFKLLVQQYQEKLYWHIRRMVESHEDANDIIQNTFLKVYKSIHRFERKSKLYTWLYRIATNEAISFLNRKNRMKIQSIDHEDLRIDHSLKADTPLNGEEIYAKLKNATKTLPQKQRIVFNMRYYDDMSYKEISEVLGTSVGSLKASFHHAVKKIEVFLVKNEL